MKRIFTKDLAAKTLSNTIVVIIGVCLTLFLLNISHFSNIFHNFVRILIPFIVGFVVAYLLTAPVRNLELLLSKVFRRKNKPAPVKLCRIVAVAITYIILTIVVILMFYMVGPRIIASLTTLFETIPGYIENLRINIDTYIVQHNITNEYLRNLLVAWEEPLSQLVAYANDLLPNLVAISFKVYNGVANSLIGIIVSIYLLCSKELFCAQCKKMAYSLLPRKYVERLIYWMRRTHQIFGKFIYGKFIDSTIIGILCYIGLRLMQIEYPLLISCVVGITNMIPFFGPFIGAIPCIVFLLVVHPINALWFGIFVIFLQQLDGNVIGPRILGNTIGLSGFWIMFAIIIGGGLFGFLGILLGVPVFAVIYAIIRSTAEYRLIAAGLPTETTAYYKDLDATGEGYHPSARLISEDDADHGDTPQE